MFLLPVVLLLEFDDVDGLLSPLLLGSGIYGIIVADVVALSTPRVAIDLILTVSVNGTPMRACSSFGSIFGYLCQQQQQLRNLKDRKTSIRIAHQTNCQQVIILQNDRSCTWITLHLVANNQQRTQNTATYQYNKIIINNNNQKKNRILT